MTTNKKEKPAPKDVSPVTDAEKAMARIMQDPIAYGQIIRRDAIKAARK